MRVTHLIIGLNVGGAELMLKRLVETFHESPGIDQDVISLTEIGVVGARIRAAGVRVQSLGMRSVADIPRILFKLVRIFRSTRPNIVQTWMYHADFLGGVAARLAGNRNIIWGVRTTNVEAGGTAATTILMHICARLSHWIPRVIVCAADASRRAHREVGYDNSRMVVIPNGFEMKMLVASEKEKVSLRAHCGFKQEAIVIGTLGRFNPAKDHKNFIDAAALIAREESNAYFLMVGRGLDSANEELRRWIDETGCSERFVLLGQRSDVAACLSAMDVFCLSSRTEGFPNVVGEAMAMSVPCVVTDVGDAAMLVSNTGIVVPKEDSVALADGLRKLIEMDKTERAELGINAKQRITAEFTIERARQRFETIYNRMLEDQRGKSDVCVDS